MQRYKIQIIFYFCKATKQYDLRKEQDILYPKGVILNQIVYKYIGLKHLLKPNTYFWLNESGIHLLHLNINK